jgi:hypothetical protein
LYTFKITDLQEFMELDALSAWRHFLVPKQHQLEGLILVVLGFGGGLQTYLPAQLAPPEIALKTFD